MKPSHVPQVNRPRFNVPKFLTIAVMAIATTLTLLLWYPAGISPAIAQSDRQVSFRLSRLESDFRGLRSQLRQLNTRISQLQRTSDGPIIQVPSAPIPFEDTTPNDIDPLDPETAAANLQFDQLATLVIETRQDMFTLQEKVEALEEQLGKGS